MGKIVIALFIMAILIFLAIYAAIRYEVKNWCDANELNFKMYWKVSVWEKILVQW